MPEVGSNGTSGGVLAPNAAAGERARCFLALEISDASRAALAELGARLAVDEGLRVVRPEALHLTLRFLGSVSRDLLPRLAMALRSSLAEVEPHPFELHGVGAFPDARRARAVWVGVVDEGQTAALAARLDSALAPLGFPRETRPFRAHVTLARCRGGRSSRFLRELLEHDAARSFGRDRATEVVLFESKLEGDGARYLPLARLSLCTA